MADNLSILVSSNIAQFVNFVLFEVVLISLIFGLTTDVSSRLNYVTLRDGSSKPLLVPAVPILGGGLSTTRRFHLSVMLLVRALGLVLIFLTALTLEGESRPVTLSITESVRVPAALRNATNVTEVEEAVSLRSSCVVTRNDTVTYGLLYGGKCEIAEDLLRGQIEFSLEPVEINLTLRECTTSAGGDGLRRLTCENEELPPRLGVFTYRPVAEETANQEELQGVAGMLPLPPVGNTQPYAVCELMDPAINESDVFRFTSSSCLTAVNLPDVAITTWRDSRFGISQSILNLVGAISVSGQATQTVQVRGSQQITTMNVLWFVCLALKLALIVTLFVCSMYLRRAGVPPILQDERALMRLLRREVYGQQGAAVHDEAPLYLRSSSDGIDSARRSFWADRAPVLPDPNADVHAQEKVHS